MWVSTSTYPVSLTIKNVLTEGFTGELAIKGKGYAKSLTFEKGDLVYARSELFDERINVILYLLGKIDDRQYEYVSGLGKNRDADLGQVMVENHFITGDDLFYATHFQVRKIAVNAFKADPAQWELRDGPAESPTGRRHRIQLPAIIAEGARKIENISFFTNKIQFLSPRTSGIPAALKPLMNADEIVLYKRLEDCRKMSNHEIISKLNLDPVFYWKTMVLYILLDIIDFKKHSHKYNIEDDIQRLIRFQEKLDGGELNPFEILGIPMSSTRSQAKLAFLKLSKMFHPDRFGSAAAPEIKRIARYVYSEIEKAYRSLRKKIKKRPAEKTRPERVVVEEYHPEFPQEIEIDLEDDPGPMEPEPAEPEEMEIQTNIQDEISMDADSRIPMEKPEPIQAGMRETREVEKGYRKEESPSPESDIQAPSVVEQAEELYAEKKYYDASKLLKTALKKEPDRADLHYLLGMSQTHMEFFQEEAERHLRKAIELNPWSSDPVYALGILFRIQGKKRQAAKCFERVITVSKDHEKAVKAMRELAQKKKEKESIFSFFRKK